MEEPRVSRYQLERYIQQSWRMVFLPALFFHWAKRKLPLPNFWLLHIIHGFELYAPLSRYSNPLILLISSINIFEYLEPTLLHLSQLRHFQTKVGYGKQWTMSKFWFCKWFCNIIFCKTPCQTMSGNWRVYELASFKTFLAQESAFLSSILSFTTQPLT